MNDKYYDTTIALAGMIQTTTLADEFAKTGKLDEAAFETSIYSIFQINAPTITDVFGGLDKLKVGLKKLAHLFDAGATSSRTQMRYLISLLQMQKKISRNASIQNQLKQRIHQAEKQVAYFSLTHNTVIANLADIYLATVNPFKFRVLIWGNQRILGVNENMEKIRVLLLAGVRAAFLWRQVGGSRLQLIFSRAKIKETAEKILQSLETAGG